MTAKDKVIAFVEDYSAQINLLKGRLDATEQRIEYLSLEIQYIDQKTLPEATERRVMTGDSKQEKDVRKKLDKFQQELEEKKNDIIVIQNIINNYMIGKADEIGQLERLVREERNLIMEEQHEKMLIAKQAYEAALKKESAILHDYVKIDADIQQILVDAGRKQNIYVGFPLSDLSKLEVSRNDLVVIVKRR